MKISLSTDRDFSIFFSYIKSVKNQEILIQELKEEINRLKAHTTTTDSPRPNIPKGSACKNKDGLEGICDDLDNCKSLNGSIVDQISVCNAEMNYVCCSKYFMTFSFPKVN